MSIGSNQQSLRELRLFLEEICCDLCRFEHSREAGLPPENVEIRQEVPLNSPEEFADIYVRVPGGPEYYVEVKFGLAPETLAARLGQKYRSVDGPIRRIVVVTRGE